MYEEVRLLKHALQRAYEMSKSGDPFGSRAWIRQAEKQVDALGTDRERTTLAAIYYARGRNDQSNGAVVDPISFAVAWSDYCATKRNTTPMNIVQAFEYFRTRFCIPNGESA